VRIDVLEQVLGEARELRLDLQLHARREESEPLEQPLHVGIGAFQAFEAEAGSDLRELLGKLGPHAAQQRKLLFVEAEEARIHAVDPIPEPRPGRSPDRTRT
jgi:hypothetical protein